DGVLCESDPASVPISNIEQSGQVTLQNTAVGDLQFETGQFVEIFDEVPLPSSLNVFKINNVVGLSITLDPSVAKVTSGFIGPRMRPVMTYKAQPDYPIANEDAPLPI